MKTEGKETLFPGSSVASAGAAMLDALFSGTKDVQQSLQLPNRNHPKVSLFSLCLSHVLSAIGIGFITQRSAPRQVKLPLTQAGLGFVWLVLSLRRRQLLTKTPCGTAPSRDQHRAIYLAVFWHFSKCLSPSPPQLKGSLCLRLLCSASPCLRAESNWCPVVVTAHPGPDVAFEPQTCGSFFPPDVHH